LSIDYTEMIGSVGFSPMKENKSRKVLKKNGPRQTTEMEKDLYWNFLFISRAIPIHLVIDENHKNLTVKVFVYLLKINW